jgi:hypothetical protein
MRCTRTGSALRSFSMLTGARRLPGSVAIRAEDLFRWRTTRT